MLRRKGSLIVRNGKPVATVITRGPTRMSTFIPEDVDVTQRVLWTNKDAHSTGVEDRFESLLVSRLLTTLACSPFVRCGSSLFCFAFF
jgi:hypothetical protein